MIWIVAFIIILAAIIGALLVGLLMRGRVAARRLIVDGNTKSLNDEASAKEKMLRDLAQISLGLAPPELCEESRVKISQAEENLRAERGRITISQAEREAVEARLRELEEIERELESSRVEASQELDMLRSQEREMTARNSQLKTELDTSLTQLDFLLEQLASSREISEQLRKTKAEILQTQQLIEQCEQEIAEYNAKYMDLKKAYDALDIEYAQLYEKQNAP